MMSIQVKTKDSVYEVYLGENILQSFCSRETDEYPKYDQLVIITDEHVWSLHEEYVRENFTLPFKLYIVPNGEACKTFESYYRVQSFLLEENCSRNSALSCIRGRSSRGFDWVCCSNIYAWYSFLPNSNDYFST